MKHKHEHCPFCLKDGKVVADGACCVCVKWRKKK